MTAVRKPVVCFLGPVASYTHQATLEKFPSDKYELLPVVTIKDVFDTTQSGRATYGVVPFENSTNGSVVFTLDHFADRQGQYPDLSVCAEIYIDVHHYLLGRLPPPGPGPDGKSEGESASSPTFPTAAAAVAAAVPSLSLTSHNNTPKLTSSHTFGPSSPLSSSFSSSEANFLSTTTSSSNEATSTGQRTPTPSDPAPQEPRSRPRAPLAHVQRIYSHPQAFGQCTRFLSAYLKGVETIDVSSTSRAAEFVRDDPTGTSAAISSAAAAALMRDDGVEVLARDIEDREDNTTRFFVLQAAARRRHGTTTTTTTTTTSTSDSSSRSTSHSNDDDNDDDDVIVAEEKQQQQQRKGSTKSLLSFTVPHTAPGALADVLSCFRAAGLNLTSIASRPSLRVPFQYVFFVEFEGHRSADPEGKVARVLEQVGEVAESSRWLGSWVCQR